MFIIMLAVVGAVVLGAYVVTKPSLDMKTSSATMLACPACGTFIQRQLEPGAIARCGSCNVYSHVEPTGLLGPVPANFVADQHVFHAYLPETVRWPNVCCVCGEAATRTEKLSLTYTVEAEFEDKLTASLGVAMLSVGTMQLESLTQKVTERINVPHCNAHAGGARMLSQGGIEFRSFRYYQLFIQLNRATFGV